MNKTETHRKHQVSDNQVKRHNISLLVNNRPGVLTRITLVFSRRGYNIDSLVVSPDRDAHYSHMNIEATGAAHTLDLMLRQLNRLIDVVKASAHETQRENLVQSELALIKIRCDKEQRNEVMQIASAFHAEVIDIGEMSMTFQVSGKSEKVDAMLKMLEVYEELDLIRTGKLIMARGEHSTS